MTTTLYDCTPDHEIPAHRGFRATFKYRGSGLDLTRTCPTLPQAAAWLMARRSFARTMSQLPLHCYILNLETNRFAPIKWQATQTEVDSFRYDAGFDTVDPEADFGLLAE